MSLQGKPERASRIAEIEESVSFLRAARGKLEDFITELKEGQKAISVEKTPNPPQMPMANLLNGLPGDLRQIGEDIRRFVDELREIIL